MAEVIAPALGARFATDEIGGAHVPLSKIAFGAADAATRVSATNPLPVAIAGGLDLSSASLLALETIELGAPSLAALENITVGGTVDLGATSLAALETITVGGTVELGAPSLAALENITVGGTVELGAGSLAALESITATGPLTDVQLRFSPVPVAVAGVATAAKQDETRASIEALRAPHYETVAAGSAAQVMGGAGAAGDLLATLTIVPATKSPGAVSIQDGAGGTAIVIFPGGADSVGTLHPFTVPVGAVSATGGWRVSAGANVSVLATGRFT